MYRWVGGWVDQVDGHNERTCAAGQKVPAHNVLEHRALARGLGANHHDLGQVHGVLANGRKHVLELVDNRNELLHAPVVQGQGAGAAAAASPGPRGRAPAAGRHLLGHETLAAAVLGRLGEARDVRLCVGGVGMGVSLCGGMGGRKEVLTGRRGGRGGGGVRGSCRHLAARGDNGCVGVRSTQRGAPWTRVGGCVVA